MSTNDDTIAAIATAPGEAGIAIIRVSGSQALAIADAIFRCSGKKPSEREAQTFVHGYVQNTTDSGGSQDVDEIVLLIYKAPHSYTREDVIELQGHGGAASARRILRAVLDAGARMAEPGEFTKRAFLSGRIDLLQAEAVMDLIRARSDRAANAALEQLEGSLSDLFSAIYENVVIVAADLEATLDFGEDELPVETMHTIQQKVDTICEDLKKLLNSWGEGHLLREGAVVVISGRPNVGKSTLLNVLLGSERAIVTQSPGTTRDTVEEQLVLSGIPLRLIDTAGLRETDCEIEQEGIRRAHHHLERADINLWVVDASESLSEEERCHIAARDPERCIVILNKCDKGKLLSHKEFSGLTCIECCLNAGMGVDQLRVEIADKLGVSPQATPHATISERHRNIIQCVLNDMNDVAELLKSQQDDMTVVAAGAIRSALETLGEVTGRTYHAELLDNIFSRFCVGK